MKVLLKYGFFLMVLTLVFSCSQKPPEKEKTAADILGNPEYLAISYGGYRAKTRDTVPTVAQIKEDMKILEAMNVKILRTYNTKMQELPNLLEAISELKKEDSKFEMYVMVGAWIDCENAWTDKPNHEAEDITANTGEIERAVMYANKYPDIIKIIAVGNEAMVKWAASYYVQPSIILKWVNYLQDLKKAGKLPQELWITSSDNFASWGGGDTIYHTEDLTKLMHAVDYLSVHTYPFHDSHYNPDFWNSPEGEHDLTDIEKSDLAIIRAKFYAISQYQNVLDYMKSLGINKPIHIGETGWASSSDGLYGTEGSRAADEFKAGLYYKYMREWTKEAKISCFYFEAFDEHWKDGGNPNGSENHFGLFTLNGEAKFALWELFDKGVFNGLKRDGKTLTKTFNGDENTLMEEVLAPPSKK